MLHTDNTAVLLIDIQERLLPVLHQADAFVQHCRTLICGTQLLGLPLLITEQYPKGLGHTVSDIRLAAKDAPVFEKTRFSAWTDDIQAALTALSVRNIILLGCETHICILQTAQDALRHGLTVYLPQECVTSRTWDNKANGLEQIRNSGAIISNTESLLFQLLQDAKHPQFKAISKLIQ